MRKLPLHSSTHEQLSAWRYLLLWAHVLPNSIFWPLPQLRLPLPCLLESPGPPGYPIQRLNFVSFLPSSPAKLNTRITRLQDRPRTVRPVVWTFTDRMLPASILPTLAPPWNQVRNSRYTPGCSPHLARSLSDTALFALGRVAGLSQAIPRFLQGPSVVVAHAQRPNHYVVL